MTTLSTHPAAEELGCFIDGTLDAKSRAAIVEHIADCDECRITVVDVTAFGEELAPPDQANGRWWVAAAAVLAITVGGIFVVQERGDPLAPLKQESAHLLSRLGAAKLNGFPYAAQKKTMRSGSDNTDVDIVALQVRAKAEDVLKSRGNDPRMQHAKGVAGLVAAEAGFAQGPLDGDDRSILIKQRTEAVAMLKSAADRAPNNVTYQSDFAAGLMSIGDRTNLLRAVEVCGRALQIESNSADALFNRAKALDLLATSRDARDVAKAIEAYNSYLAVDGSSPWAVEARDRIGALRLYTEPQ